VGNGLRPNSIRQFLAGLPNAFQRGQSEGLEATYHFTFTGEESGQATVVIAKKTLEVHRGHVGARTLHVIADSRTWLAFVRKERNLFWALLSAKIRIQGPPRLLTAFGKCFPS
jgi:putative sterol carrier protein